MILFWLTTFCFVVEGNGDDGVGVGLGVVVGERVVILVLVNFSFLAGGGEKVVAVGVLVVVVVLVVEDGVDALAFVVGTLGCFVVGGGVCVGFVGEGRTDVNVGSVGVVGGVDAEKSSISPTSPLKMVVGEGKGEKGEGETAEGRGAKGRGEELEGEGEGGRRAEGEGD